jgi:hypothetical protein
MVAFYSFPDLGTASKAVGVDRLGFCRQPFALQAGEAGGASAGAHVPGEVPASMPSGDLNAHGGRSLCRGGGVLGQLEVESAVRVQSNSCVIHGDG